MIPDAVVADLVQLETILIALIGLVEHVVWPGFLFALIWLFRTQIAERLQHLKFKAAGMEGEITFRRTQKGLLSAVAAGELEKQLAEKLSDSLSSNIRDEIVSAVKSEIELVDDDEIRIVDYLRNCRGNTALSRDVFHAVGMNRYSDFIATLEKLTRRAIVRVKPDDPDAIISLVGAGEGE